MIRLRKQCPEIGWGDWQLLPTGANPILAIEYSWRGSTIVCLHNLSGQTREAEVRSEHETLASLVEVEELHAAAGAHRIALEPYGYRWYRAGALDQTLERQAFG
jgi:maltose alpha-D-glucosyltransferase/alpha-amylase